MGISTGALHAAGTMNWSYLTYGSSGWRRLRRRSRPRHCASAKMPAMTPAKMRMDDDSATIGTGGARLRLVSGNGGLELRKAR